MLDLNESDIYYAPLPLFHIAGQFALVYAACIAGATAVLPGTFSARRFWRDVRRHNASATFLLGAMANFLYRQEPAQDDANNPIERGADGAADTADRGVQDPLRLHGLDDLGRDGDELPSAIAQTELREHRQQVHLLAPLPAESGGG